MSKIRSKDSKPELIVRRIAHALGFRYRLHRKSLPGNPDMVFPSRQKVIFIHGCFWHQHKGCKLASDPKSRRGYWGPKLKRNIERDKAAMRELEQAGWQVLVIWECETRELERLENTIVSFLGPAKSGSGFMKQD